MFNKLKLYFVMLLLATGVLALQASADESKIPEPFRGASPGSPIQINYGDWNRILHLTVIDAGSSHGRSAPAPRPKIGTRVVHGNTKSTRNEGNRLVFPAFADNEKNLKVVHDIRTDLEKVPSEVPMKQWSKNEQLAYWLNLYNITLIEMLAHEYPVRSLKKLKHGSHSLWKKKVLTVAGVKLSLNDIHNILVNKWDTSLVMYGLFQGYIGGPNIMDEAFTGANVHRLLVKNAREFVASTRGMRIRGKELIVSDYYKENKKLFPHWKTDLKKHLADLTDPIDRARVMDAKKIKAKTNDYYIADLFGGTRSTGTGSADNPAALDSAIIHAMSGEAGAAGGAANLGIANMNLGEYADFKKADIDTRFPDFVKDYIKNVRKNKSMMKGKVEVEEFDGKKKDDKKDKPKK